MAMSLKESMRNWRLLRRDYTSCNQPSPGNIAIFFDEHHSMAYAGVVICFFAFPIPDSFQTSLSHCHWYKKLRALQPGI